MEAIAIVGALAGGVVLGWLLRKADDSMKIKLLTRQRDDARKENVGRLTHVYWQGVRNSRLQMAAESRGMAENAESVGRRFRGGRPA